MRVKSITKTVGVCMAMSCAVFVATGCSFDPLSYMSRNACEFFNCDELFFIEDLLPLSAQPAGGTEAVMVMGEEEEEDEGGGHAH